MGEREIMKKSRIGILSFAHVHAHSYAACLNRFADRVELAGVYHENEAEGKEFDGKFSAGGYCASVEDLLARDLDGVIVCSANVDHKEHVIAASRKVSAVLCEKPIATALDDARAMIDACGENDARLMIAYPCRYSPAAARTRNRIRNGDLGRILGVCSTNHGKYPGGWFGEKERSGGGAVMDHTVHVADLWRWMMGTEVTTVYAEATRALHPIEVEDCGLLSVTFDSGAVGSLDASWSRPASFPTWADVYIEFVGEEGLLEMDLFTQNLNFYSNRAGGLVWTPYGDDFDLLMIRDFLTMVETGGPSPVTGEDGLRSLELAIAAYQSIETGRTVELPV
jgi:predicted dehydrogenase